MNYNIDVPGFDGSFNWFAGLLLILLIVIISLWYREYRNNKKIAKINEEIDLR